MGESSKPAEETPVLAVLSLADPVLVAGLGFFQVGMTTRWLPLNRGLPELPSETQSLVLLSCFVAILTFALFLALHARVSYWLNSTAWKASVGALALLGVVAVSAGPALSSAGLGVAWVVVTAFLTGIGSASLLLAWVIRCIDSASVLNFPLAFLFAAIGLVLCGFLEMPDSAASIALAVAPVLFSAVLLFVERGSAGQSQSVAIKGLSQGLAVFMIKVGLGALMVSMANEMIKLVRPEGFSVVLGSGFGSWITVIAMVVATAGVVHQLRSGKPSGFYFLCKGAIVLCVFGALLFPYAGAASQFLFSVSTAGRQCLQLLVWMIVYLVCRKHQLPPIVFFSFMCVAWYGGSLAGSALFDVFQAMDPLGSLWGSELVSVMAVLLLVVAYVFLFSEKDSDLMFGEERASKKERAFHKACEQLSAKGRLTSREQEVFYLLAKGAPVSAIEEKLFISSSTVSTHMKHIYQKLGVHSRGELYDMVDDTLRCLPLEK